MSNKKPAEQVRVIYQTVNAVLNPEPIRVYKPRSGGGGAALKLHLRLAPTIETSDEGSEYVKSVDGGLFLELALQEGTVQVGTRKFPSFAWRDQKTLLRSKLGLNDLSALIVAIREVRYKNRPVPTLLRPRQGDKVARQVGLFHKFGSGTMSITYTFDPEQSIIRMSKSATEYRSIALTLAEELVFERYLNRCLDAFLAVGHR